MFQKVEREYKFTLSKEAYIDFNMQCEKELPVKSRNVQVNYYYDTADNYYNSQRQTIRIRQKESKLELQVKKHGHKKEGLQISNEYTQSVDYLPKSLHSELIEKTVFFRGSLVTYRTIYVIGKSSIVCSDLNMYLGVCDYEVEIEIADEDEKLIAEFIKKYGLISSSKKGKSSRFFERLKEMNK